jgi:hypothetical protein
VSDADTFDVFAIRYGRFEERMRSETFLAIDLHDTAPMPLNYSVWVIRNKHPR